jgi:hypothetical protein
MKDKTPTSQNNLNRSKFNTKTRYIPSIISDNSSVSFINKTILIF